MNIICKILGHKLKIIRCIQPLTIYELRCKRCGCEFGYHRIVKALLQLDAELKEAHGWCIHD